jgi:monoamine oxidase
VDALSDMRLVRWSLLRKGVTLSQRMKVIVVGAGLAGLTCAKVFVQRGAEVVVFEAWDGIGVRIGTEEKDGLLLDWEYTEDSSINGSMLSGEKEEVMCA